MIDCKIILFYFILFLNNKHDHHNSRCVKKVKETLIVTSGSKVRLIDAKTFTATTQHQITEVFPWPIIVSKCIIILNHLFKEIK